MDKHNRTDKLKNLFFFFSGALFIAFFTPVFSPEDPRHLVLSGLFCLTLLGITIRCHPASGFCLHRCAPRRFLFSGLLAALGAAFFVLRWQGSDTLSTVSTSLGVSGLLLLTVFAVISAVVCVYFLLIVLAAVRRCVYAPMGSHLSPHTAAHTSWKHWLFFLLTAAVGVTLCSRSSPLYAFNFSMDPNCFLTVARAMAKGRILYRDIFEQKGPLLYALHMLAYFISHDSFLGVYLLEIAAGTVLFHYSYKILRLYGGTEVILLLPLLAAVLYGSHNFSYGDNTEELCMPLMAYGLYTILRALEKDALPSSRQFFLIGLTAGCVLWTKYTMLGFYIGWIVYPAWKMIAERRWKQLFCAFGAILGGAAISSLPWLIYFGANGALGDLIQAYFYDNMVVYSSGKSQSTILSLFINLWSGLRSTLLNNPLPGLLWITGGVFYAFRGKKSLMLQYLLCFCFTVLFIFGGGRHYQYYSSALGVFTVCGMLPLCALCRSALCGRRLRSRWAVSAAALLCGAAAAALLTDNLPIAKYDLEDYPQYQFKQIIDSVEEPTLLNYGFLDNGFYNICDIVPTCKFFCKLNIPLEEMTRTQEYYLGAGLVDFVVTRDTLIYSGKYELLASSHFPFEGKERTFYLYGLKTLGLG